MQTIKRWKDRGTRHGGKSMLLASAALTVMMMNAGLAKADNECGSGSPVFCKASSYGNITYPDGGVVLLENSDMIVTGNITIGSLSNSGGQAFFSASLYRSISGAINVSAPTDGAVIGINTPSITGVPAITGPIAATAAGTGDASITIHQDVWVRSAMSSRAVASYQKNSGDAVVTIEAGAFIDQVGDSLAVLTENIGSGNAVVNINGGTIRNEGGAIVRADNQGIGNTSITLASGRIVGAGANSVGLEAHATSDGSTASVIVTSGTIENTAEAIDVYHRDGDGTALVSIDETTGETKIDGEIYIDATVTQFKLFDGDLSTTIPGGFEGVVILDSAVATADLMGGTITTFKDSASAAVYLTNSDYNEDPDMLEANLIGTKINISGNGGAAFFLDVFDNDRNSQVNISGGSIRDQGATSRTQAVTFEPDGLNDTFGFDMSGGLIQLDAQDAVGVLVTTGAGTNYEFDLSGGEISIDKGTVIFIDVPIDNLDSLNGAISVSVAIGEKMTASGGKALLDNWNTSEDTVIDFTTSGTVAGDIFGGAGKINFAWTGGTFKNNFYGQRGDDTATLSGIYFGSTPINNVFDGGEADDGQDTQADIDTISFTKGLTATRLNAENILNWEKLSVENAAIGFTGSQLVLDGYSSGNSNDLGDFTIGTSSAVTLETSIQISANMTISNALSILGDSAPEISGNFQNDGSIRMNDGTARGSLKIGGDYSAGSSQSPGYGTLSVNVDLAGGMSDQVIIQGTISGRTKVVLNKIMDAPMPEDGILIVKAPENSPSYAFSGSLISGANTYHIGFRNTSGNGMPSGYYLMP